MTDDEEIIKRYFDDREDIYYIPAYKHPFWAQWVHCFGILPCVPKQILQSMFLHIKINVFALKKYISPLPFACYPFTDNEAYFKVKPNYPQVLHSFCAPYFISCFTL